MPLPVPPYFDFLIGAFRPGTSSRYVHLGHWESPAPDLDAPSEPDEFARAQAMLDAYLLEMADLRAGLSVLDVGCGFGGTLDAINRRLDRMQLTGVNIDPRQLEICNGIEARNGNRLRWEEADACALPFADSSFDRVLCIEAMFHFRSRRDFFREAARVLKPGGVLVASDIVLTQTCRNLRAGNPGIEVLLTQGYGPWPDFWGDDADHANLAAAAGLQCRTLDATPNTLRSHRFTVPAGLDERRDPGEPALRAGLMLRRLHRDGLLNYLYIRCDKAA